jgi:hypothetical protein
MTRANGPRPAPAFGRLDACKAIRSPERATAFERISSSKTARGETSPPNSFTSRSNEGLLPATTRVLGRPLRVRNRLSVIHPLTTRSAGMRAVASDPNGADDVRLSIRRISFRGKPVNAATFEWLTLPFRICACRAAARTNASRATLEKPFGVIPRGSSASASSRSSCCRCASRLSAGLSLPLTRGLRRDVSAARGNFGGRPSSREFRSFSARAHSDDQPSSAKGKSAFLVHLCIYALLTRPKRRWRNRVPSAMQTRPTKAKQRRLYNCASRELAKDCPRR